MVGVDGMAAMAVGGVLVSVIPSFAVEAGLARMSGISVHWKGLHG